MYKRQVYSSGAILTNPFAYEFEAAGNQWKLEIMAKAGWTNYKQLYGILAGGLLIVLLLTGQMCIRDSNRGTERSKPSIFIHVLWNAKRIDSSLTIYP